MAAVEDALNGREHDQRKKGDDGAADEPDRGSRGLVPDQPEAALDAEQETTLDQGNTGGKHLRLLGHRYLRDVGVVRTRRLMTACDAVNGSTRGRAAGRRMTDRPGPPTMRRP